jgi:protein O-GlcNAc transferase
MTIPEAFDLALRRHQAGRLADAEALYRQILAVQPNHAEARHLVGVIAHQTGRDDLAVEWIRQAIALNPNICAAHCNLGEAYRALGRLDEAMAAYRRALELKPDYPEAHNNLGAALKDRGQVDEAMAAYRRALELKPGFPQAHNNLGVALRERGRLDEAIAAYRRALELRPGDPETRYNLGNALRERGHLDEAVAAYGHALELKPDLAEALNNLGNALRDRGELDEAIAAYRRAIQMKPDYVGAHSNLIFAFHFHPSHDASSIAREHERWNRQFSDPLRQYRQPHANSRNPERRLRVGYVSPDFRDHVVGRYALPLLERHDREGFDILCYSGVARPDWMTERLRALASGWRNTVGLPDARLAEMIREDGVDILVDLTMHAADNRLPVFARQPAPVQVTWLAYPGSTGLSSIGYRLTDAHMDPPGQESAWSVEEPVRLPDCWCCYEPVGDAPEINALPALSAKGVTFGSLNNFAKVHEGVLALWVRVLEAVKGSRLLMLCPKGRARERVRALFGARGIGVDRLDLVGLLPREEYLRLYQRIDIGLDPFPYNGMTTTCDALWMGVPVLTLPGQMPASKAGLSLLSSVGLGEWAATSEEDHVQMAVELAGNLRRLAELRATLRARMRASPLMDAPRFARNVEAAYRKMWQAWCTGQATIRKET